MQTLTLPENPESPPRPTVATVPPPVMRRKRLRPRFGPYDSDRPPTRAFGQVPGQEGQTLAGQVAEGDLRAWAREVLELGLIDEPKANGPSAGAPPCYAFAKVGPVAASTEKQQQNALNCDEEMQCKDSRTPPPPRTPGGSKLPSPPGDGSQVTTIGDGEPKFNININAEHAAEELLSPRSSYRDVVL